ncbi:MAG: hypothetical protein ACXVB8_21645, partial [Bdellovibrionota bacterium]
MNIILASYGRIFWRWRESDPHQVIVDKARKISLVNPKHYFEPEFRSDRCCWRLGDGSVVLETDHIGLHIESIEDE